MEQQLQQERIVIENDDEIEIDLKDLKISNSIPQPIQKQTGNKQF